MAQTTARTKATATARRLIPILTYTVRAEIVFAQDFQVVSEPELILPIARHGPRVWTGRLASSNPRTARLMVKAGVPTAENAVQRALAVTPSLGGGVLRAKADDLRAKLVALNADSVRQRTGSARAKVGTGIAEDRSAVAEVWTDRA